MCKSSGGGGAGGAGGHNLELHNANNVLRRGEVKVAHSFSPRTFSSIPVLCAIIASPSFFGTAQIRNTPLLCNYRRHESSRCRRWESSHPDLDPDPDPDPDSDPLVSSMTGNCAAANARSCSPQTWQLCTTQLTWVTRPITRTSERATQDA